MRKTLSLSSILFFLLIVSCTNTSKVPPVDPVVQERCDSIEVELNRLLADSSDTLIKEGLHFLMEHLPYRTHHANKGIDLYRDSILKYVSVPKLQETTLRQLALTYSSRDMQKEVGDAMVVKGDQLMAHVSTVVDFHRLTSWVDQIAFADFCEYLLPYNSLSYSADHWMQYYRDLYFQENDSAILSMPLAEAAETVHKWIYKKTKGFRIRWGEDGLYIPDLLPVTYDYLRVGSCDDVAKRTAFVMRSLGIPTAIDLTPTYLNFSSGHSWNAAVLHENQCYPFAGHLEENSKYKPERRKIAKVYRQSFSNQRKQQEYLVNKRKSAPQLPVVFFSQDVTDQYVETTDLIVPTKMQFFNDDNIGFLAVFTREGWQPVAWSEIINNCLVFPKVGRDGIYRVQNASGNNIGKIDAPILLKACGELLHLTPELDDAVSLNLTRKFPLDARKEEFLSGMIGGRFEGANKPDFSDATLLAEIKNHPGEHFNTVIVDMAIPYKYVRYLPMPDSKGGVAEIKFFGVGSGQIPLNGEVIGNPQWESWLARAFDDQPLTFFSSRKENVWVGLEFEKPETLSKIMYLARTDMNAIQPGDEYELLYLDGEWKSLGRQVADATTLQYHNAPSNALFWLRNLSGGKEERIFTYENGQQVWW